MKLRFLLPLMAFAPVDMAAAGTGEAESPVLEIVTFRLNDGVDQVEFLSAAEGTERLLRERGALVRRFLTVDDDGIWTDVIDWQSLPEALTAAEEVLRHPDFAPFGSMIDGSTVSMPRRNPLANGVSLCAEPTAFSN